MLHRTLTAWLRWKIGEALIDEGTGFLGLVTDEGMVRVGEGLTQMKEEFK